MLRTISIAVAFLLSAMAFGLAAAEQAAPTGEVARVVGAERSLVVGGLKYRVAPAARVRHVQAPDRAFSFADIARGEVVGFGRSFEGRDGKPVVNEVWLFGQGAAAPVQ